MSHSWAICFVAATSGIVFPPAMFPPVHARGSFKAMLFLGAGVGDPRDCITNGLRQLMAHCVRKILNNLLGDDIGTRRSRMSVFPLTHFGSRGFSPRMRVIESRFGWRSHVRLLDCWMIRCCDDKLHSCAPVFPDLLWQARGDKHTMITRMKGPMVMLVTAWGP